jgi:ssDNA-binding replication factor A large subunit
MSEVFIKDIEPEKNFDYLYCEITEIKPVREYDYGDKKSKVLDMTVKDKKGDAVHLTLWNSGVRLHELEPFKIGDKILIVLGWCRLYNGYKQISTGKIGIITRVPERELPSVKQVIEAAVKKKKVKA